jgi:hypothetical protein
VRAKEFTFKKTRTVKTTTDYVGLSLDLTVEEAIGLEKALADLPYTTINSRIYRALYAFLKTNRGKPSPKDPDIKPELVPF